MLIDLRMILAHVLVEGFFLNELHLALEAFQAFSEVDEPDMSIEMMLIPEGHDAEWTLALFNICM